MTLEQLHPDPGLRLAQGATDGGLRQVQVVGSRSGAADGGE
jgi:hypothetical protein